MKKIDLGQASDITNVGVIAEVVFLALELHQNNAQLDNPVPEAKPRGPGTRTCSDARAEARRDHGLSERCSLETDALGFYIPRLGRK